MTDEAFVPGEFPVEIRELPCMVGTERLYGVALIPQGVQGPLPTVIFSHGYRDTHDTVLPRLLAARGIACYAFDFRGGSPLSRSGGSTTEMSVRTNMEDLHAVLDQVRQWDLVDRERLFLLGASQGGFVSAAVAARCPAQVRGLLLLYPAFVIRDDMTSHYATLEEVPEVVRFMGMNIGRRYYQDIWDFEIYPRLAHYPGEVLIFHGDRDQLVDLDYSRRALEAFPAARLVVLPGERHGFSPQATRAVARQCIDFVAAHPRR